MPLLSPADFNLKYQTEYPAAIYADWVAIAEARAAIFPATPPQYRVLAAEYYLGYLLCITAGARQPSEVERFEVKPEGYSVAYAKGGAGKCDRWLEFLRQLGIAAGVQIPELQKVTPLYANRTEKFQFEF